MIDLAALLPEGISFGAAASLLALSFATSALTSAFGIGGGMTMRGALAALAPPATIIAVHAVVQLGSNLGRTIVQRRHARWRMVAFFTGGSLVGVALGAAIFTALPTRALLAGLGLFILVMVGRRSCGYRASSGQGLSRAG